MDAEQHVTKIAERVREIGFEAATVATMAEHREMIDSLVQTLGTLTESVKILSKITVMVKDERRCAECGGSGDVRRPGTDDYIPCVACNGKGF